MTRRLRKSIVTRRFYTATKWSVASVLSSTRIEEPVRMYSHKISPPAYIVYNNVNKSLEKRSFVLLPPPVAVSED